MSAPGVRIRLPPHNKKDLELFQGLFRFYTVERLAI